MSGNTKVVQLNQVRNGDFQNSPLRLPLPLVKLRDQRGEQLKELMRKMFESADDSLFQLADRASSNTDQTLYFDAMREVRLKRSKLEADFMQAYGKAFASLGAAVSGLHKPLEINIDSLSLVNNEELEEKVAVENMVTKVKNRFTAELQHLMLRIDSLLGNLHLQEDQNPLGPQVLCDAFFSACKGLEIDIRAKLVLMKLFDRCVLEQLQDVLDAANESLAEQGVLPDIKVVRQNTQARRPVPAKPSATANGGNGQNSSEVSNPQIFGVLQELLAKRRSDADVEQINPAYLNLPVISQVDLVTMLSQVQQKLVEKINAASGRQIDLRKLSHALMLRDGKPQRRVAQMDEDVINLVAMLFEFILADRQLPLVMKALISRLQIPMLKVAILDKEFFSKNGHPARRLLNELANAAIGWNEKAEGEADPLREKIEGIVGHLVTDFKDDISVFDEILQDFNKFMETEKRRGQLVEQRTRDAEEGKAKSELARLDVQKVLNEALNGQSVPESVMRLLRDGWSNVLVLIRLKKGVESDEWNHAVKLARDLVWSVNPPADRNARRQLLQLIPNLLKGLREGLSTTSFSPFEMDKLLKELEAFHLKALQRLAARPAAEAAMPAERLDAQPTAHELAALAAVAKMTQTPEIPVDNGDDKPQVVIIDQTASAKAQPVAGEEAAATQKAVEAVAIAPMAKPTPAVEEIVLVEPEAPADAIAIADDDAFLLKVDQMRPGCWVEIHEDADKKFRCKLAAVIQTTGKFIFVNRTGVKVAEKSRKCLAAEMREGRVNLLDDGLLFDRALEAVIGNLRTKK